MTTSTPASKTGHWVTHAGRFAWRCERCSAGTNCETRGEADIVAITHKCEWRGVNMPEGKSLLEQAWEQLDDQVDEIGDLNRGVAELGANGAPYDQVLLASGHLRAAKARARGKAEVLALFMAPHFTTADEIGAEAGRRAKARAAGDATYQTAGLGSRRTEAPK